LLLLEPAITMEILLWEEMTFRTLFYVAGYKAVPISPLEEGREERSFLKLRKRYGSRYCSDGYKL